jgi:hypothetical protein
LKFLYPLLSEKKYFAYFRKASVIMSDLDALPTSQVVEHAITLWEKLTGVSAESDGFTLADWDVRQMNQSMANANKLDPEGTTAYLLLECFLRYYLEQKTFTAAEIMKDYAANSAYLKQAEELFSVVQSERALELASAFRSKVIEGVTHYGADREDVLELINDPDALPFLRRDALRSIEQLNPFQFLQGEAGTGPAQVIEHVYIAWNINDLLIALRDMPVSGVSVVLLRDPANPDRSYFCFAMRNGGTVTLFTDKSRPAYPGQEGVLAGRGGRGAGRTFMKREAQNYFPYQLIKTSVDEEGELVFDKETAPVAAGKSVVPLMPIKDLPAHQVIWLTMMLSLISEKFWKQDWKAEALSYTGAMVREKSLLVEDHSGAQLPVAQGYTPITLEDVKVEDLTRTAMDPQLDRASVGVNHWLEERYRNAVPHEVINQWHIDEDTTVMLTSPKPKKDHQKPIGTEIGPGLVRIDSSKNLASWERPSGYELQGFSATDFGTEQQLREDRLFIARSNMARYIQRSADEEYIKRKAEVEKWYLKAVRKNLPALLDRIAAKSIARKEDPKSLFDRYLTLDEVKGTSWDNVYYTHNWIADDYYPHSHKWTCIITGAASTYRAMFSPKNAEDLALLCGCEVNGLPDVLQNWVWEKPYTGNNLLNRVDPMDSYVDDPWMKFPVEVNVFLSKRGLAQVEKRHASS